VFRKLISNLPYSPALIEDIGFYAKRLRGEEVTRRTTVLFVVLALIMQSLAVFSPPESANASSEQDIIRGGVSDLKDFLVRYDHNEEDVKDIYSAAGISRSEIATTHPGTIQASDNTYVMSRYGQLSPSGKEVSMSYQRSVGGMGVRYFSPLASIGGSGSHFNGWVGHSATLGWFGIIQASGSLATHGLPVSLSPANATTANAVKTVSAVNLSQNSVPTETKTAQPLDKIVYSIKLSNPHTVSVTGVFSVRIADILEYATLIDGGGGILDENTGTLSWSQVQLGLGQSQERTFAIQLASSFPATAVGNSNPASYDCKLTLVFGNEQITRVECPPEKGVESLFTQLPPTDMWMNILFGSVLLLIVVFFYFRTRQMKKEIRIIRHNFNTGII
jgi:hypothetical protein